MADFKSDSTVGNVSGHQGAFVLVNAQPDQADHDGGSTHKPASAGRRVSCSRNARRRDGSRSSLIHLCAAEKVNLDSIQNLLSEALQSDIGDRDTPRIFSVIQDEGLLSLLSRTTQRYLVYDARLSAGTARPYGVHLFEDATALITVYRRLSDRDAISACWHMAERMLVKAHDVGLHARVSGLAVPALNTSEWKNRLGVPGNAHAVAPVVIGEKKT